MRSDINKRKDNSNRSLGSVRQNPNWTRQSNLPEALGRIRFTRKHIEFMYHQLQLADEASIEARVASWTTFKNDAQGDMDAFMTVEIQPVDTIPIGAKPPTEWLKLQGLETLRE